MGSINGIIKVLICTNAAGMGVNFFKVSTVTSYGPPQDMDTFVQHIGRAGRNGDQATHLLIFNGRQLRNCEKDVILYAKNNDRCRRELLLAPFGAAASQQDNDFGAAIDTLIDQDELGKVRPLCATVPDTDAYQELLKSAKKQSTIFSNVFLNRNVTPLERSWWKSLRKERKRNRRGRRRMERM